MVRKITTKKKRFIYFLDTLIKNEWQYGGKKYAHNNEREATDIIFDIFGPSFLWSTFYKYCRRYRNVGREKDLLKIGCYMFITYLKRGFFIREDGINDPPLDTSLTQKEKYWPQFKELMIREFDYREKYEKKEHGKSYNPNTEHILTTIENTLEDFNKKEWGEIAISKLVGIFILSFIEWNRKFASKGLAGKDADIYHPKDTK